MSAIPPWKLIEAAMQGGDLDLALLQLNLPGDRSPAAIARIISQFNVTESERYRRNARLPPGMLGTWCNRFVCDVTRALGCGIPMMPANDFQHWFHTSGVRAGWSPANPLNVKLLVRMGLPVVGNYFNPNGHGHVMLFRQPALDANQPAYQRGEFFVAQAGALNSEEISLSKVLPLSSVTFWSHT